MKHRARRSRPPVESRIPSGKSPSNLPQWLVYLLPVAATLLLFSPAMPNMMRHYLGSSDLDMFIAYRHFVAFALGALRDGEFPLWNPYTFCGAPFLPNTSATLVYPPNWLPLALLPQPLSINVIMIGHVALLGVFTTYYARVRNMSDWAAIFAGCTASLSSVLVPRVFAGHLTIVCSTAWVPLLFALQLQLFRSGFRFVIPVALIGVVTFLGGYPQISYYAAILMAANLLLHGLFQHQGSRLQWIVRQFGFHIVAALLAFLLAAVDALPLLDVARNSARAVFEGTRSLRFFSLPPENLVTLAAPGFFGIRSGQYVSSWYPWEVVHYAGLVTLCLAAAGMLVAASRRRFVDAHVLFLLAALLAVIGYIPVLNEVMVHVPAWTMFRGHTKIMAVGLVFLIIAAGHTMDEILAGDARLRRTTIWCFAGFAVLSLAMLALAGQSFWKVFLTSPGRQPDLMVEVVHQDEAVRIAQWNARASAVRMLILALSAAIPILYTKLSSRTLAAVLIILSCIDLFHFSFRWAGTSFSPESGEPLTPRAYQSFRSKSQASRCDCVPEGLWARAMSERIRAFSGYDNVVSRYTNTFMSAYLGTEVSTRNQVVGLPTDNPLLDLAGLEYIAVPANAGRIAGNVEPVMEEGPVRIWRRKGALPRAYVVGRERIVPDDETAIYSALTNAPDPNTVIIVGRLEQPTSSSVATAIPARVEDHGLHEVHVKAPAAGWLVLTDSYYPNWRATVAGKPVKVYRANSAFRAVLVQAGDNVIFRYANGAFAVGAWITSGTLFLLAGYMAWVWLRHRTRRRNPNPA